MATRLNLPTWLEEERPSRLWMIAGLALGLIGTASMGLSIHLSETARWRELVPHFGAAATDPHFESITSAREDPDAWQGETNVMLVRSKLLGGVAWIWWSASVALIFIAAKRNQDYRIQRLAWETARRMNES